VRNEVLHTVEGEGNIIHKINWRNAKIIRQILRRNSLLKQAGEEKIEARIYVTEGIWRMCKQLP
jgi:chorismate mutase